MVTNSRPVLRHGCYILNLKNNFKIQWLGVQWKPSHFSPVPLIGAGKSIKSSLPKRHLEAACTTTEALLGSLPGKSGVGLATLLFYLKRAISHAWGVGTMSLRTLPAVSGMDCPQGPSPLPPLPVAGRPRTMNIQASALKAHCVIWLLWSQGSACTRVKIQFLQWLEICNAWLGNTSIKRACESSLSCLRLITLRTSAFQRVTWKGLQWRH